MTELRVLNNRQGHILLSYIHDSLKRKLKEKHGNSLTLLTPEMLEDILDEYYQRFLSTMAEALRQGYTVRANGLFSLKVRFEKVKGFKHPYRIKGYVKFSEKFKKALLTGKGVKSPYVVEVVNKNTGEVILNAPSTDRTG